jgi:flavin reductase (DIM6/NTAB) family NADH-FMN oxidoreductase RutF
LSIFDRLRRPASRGNEAYKSVNPQDNFYQSSAFYPMPFALATTVSEMGHTSIGPYSLCFPLDIIEEPSMLLVARSSSNTATNLRCGSKVALNFIEFRKSWLRHVVNLGYPGLDPVEKMTNIPFALTRSPNARYADDPSYPLIMQDAFQVFECEVGGAFRYEPERVTDSTAVESYWRLKITNILLKESVHTRLIGQKQFPDVPISYGFRHNDAGDARFFFCSHNKPFAVHVPKPAGAESSHIYYVANKIDPQVRFNEEACGLLVDVPGVFLKVALKGIVKAAKAEGVTMVDTEFMKKCNARRKAA